MEEAKEILFGPKNGKTLIRSYPELEAVPEFKKLGPAELLFVWYIANLSSPVDYGWNNSIRYTTAASLAFPNDPIKKEKYANQDLPEDVRVAMRKMEKYSPDARMVAKRMTQTMFHNLQKIVDVHLDQFVKIDSEGNSSVDWSGKKQYVDMCQKTSEMLPVLIKQLEEGFGITENKKGEDLGKKAIDKFHAEKK